MCLACASGCWQVWCMVPKGGRCFVPSCNGWGGSYAGLRILRLHIVAVTSASCGLLRVSLLLPSPCSTGMRWLEGRTVGSITAVLVVHHSSRVCLPGQGIALSWATVQGGSPFRGFWKSAQTGPGQGKHRVCGWRHVAARWLAPVRCVQRFNKRSFSGGSLKRGHIAFVAKEAYASIQNHCLCTIIYFYIYMFVY